MWERELRAPDWIPISLKWPVTMFSRDVPFPSVCQCLNASSVRLHTWATQLIYLTEAWGDRREKAWTRNYKTKPAFNNKLGFRGWCAAHYGADSGGEADYCHTQMKISGILPIRDDISQGGNQLNKHFAVTNSQIWKGGPGKYYSLMSLTLKISM